MRLLFDQNVSPRLPQLLADVFPGSEHVEEIGLGSAPDAQVWEYARTHDLVIVSKDDDYSQMSVLLGSPPKVIWLLTGNCTTARIEIVPRGHLSDILSFESDDSVGVLALA